MRGTLVQDRIVEAVIDTGFNGLLMLPVQMIADLGLPYTMLTRALLADGSQVAIRVFEGSVVWDGQEQTVAVLATDGDALVGMAMLSGYRVTLDVEDGGAVLIQALA